MKFSELGLNDSLLEAIGHMGFENATPIQEKAIPVILSGKDVMGCAQTGTGKTAAFLLPILHKLAENPSDKTKALIICPTRELAMQIDQQIEGLSYFIGVDSLAIYGGDGGGGSWKSQKKALELGANVIVATPGKLLAHLKLESTRFDDLEFLVLDEADRMLDIGFYDDIMYILSFLPEKRQNLMFSATFAAKIKQMSQRVLNNPTSISLELAKPAAGVDQKAFLTFDNQKIPLLIQILKDRKEYKSIIIFSSSKQKVSDINYSLRKANVKARSISSSLTQTEREETLLAFKNRKTRVLVATDVISRGIDIKDINLIINFDCPHDAADYVHRVGRTARAETKGEAITFINPKDMSRFDRIEKLIETEIKKETVPESMGKSPEWKITSFKKKKYNNKKNFNKKKYRK